MKRLLGEGVLEIDLVNMVYNRLYDLQLKEPGTDNPLQLLTEENNYQNQVLVHKPNKDFCTPILNIELRPINLTSTDDFGLVPSVFISYDSTVSSPPDELAIDSSAQRVFFRLEFVLKSGYGAPITIEPGPEPNIAADLTIQTAWLMRDLRKQLSRKNFHGRSISENAYIADARIIRSMFDQRVRNTDNEIYIVLFMIAYSYPDGNNRV